MSNKDLPKDERYLVEMSPDVLLTIEDIAKADDMPVIRMDVPEWGGYIRLQGMTLRQRQSYFKFNKSTEDEDGNIDMAEVSLNALSKAFIEPKVSEEQLKVLELKDPAVLDRIIQAYLELSGIDVDGLVEARKNSSTEEEKS